MSRITRRLFLAGSTGLVAGAATGGIARPAFAQGTGVTEQLISAAKAEGVVNYYTSVEIEVATRVARAFEAKYPGVSVKVERTGAERVFQRIGQETTARIYNCDVVNSSDAAHFVVWKRNGLLAKWLPAEVTRLWPADFRDRDGYHAIWRITLCVMARNTQQVSAADAPKSFQDLLNPRWESKLVKAHPGYSGTILTATYAMSQRLGWPYMEKLAAQKVLQVQSASEPPRKLAVGERAVQIDGTEYSTRNVRVRGAPVEIIYATEGSPIVAGPKSMMARAPHPNAARLFMHYMFSEECQQLMADAGSLRSAHPGVKRPADLPALTDVPTIKDDAAAVARLAADIKRRYTRIFGT